jgi:hypothetical protein
MPRFQAARAPRCATRTESGNRERQQNLMADFGVIPCFREAGHGIHRSSTDVH